MKQVENFYLRKKKYWLRFYRSIFNHRKVKRFVLLKYLKPEKISGIKDKVQKQFEDLLTQIPDLGHTKISSFSIDIIKTLLSLAFYRVLKKEEGLQIRTIGQIIYEIAEVYYANLNFFTKFLMRLPYFSSSFQKKARIILEKRKNTADPEDYHCNFIEGDGKNFLFGVDYTNCAGLHLLRHQNALEIAPYLCLCDYPMFRGINIGFNREQNLAIGGSVCAFRFYRKYPTLKGWPPEEVPEYKDYKFKE